MSNIYVGQTSLRIQLTCGVDVTDASEIKIMYKKPSGTTGKWNAEVLSALQGIIFYDLVKEEADVKPELDQAGEWTFWACVKFSDFRIGYGDPVKVTVKKRI